MTRPENQLETYFQNVPKDSNLNYLEHKIRKMFANPMILTPHFDQYRYPDELNNGLTNWLLLNRPVNVLDCAAGLGYICQDLLKYPNLHVQAIDKFTDKNRIIKDNLNWTEDDLNEKLKFNSESFNAVLGLFILRYLNDPIFTLNEMIRVTKKNGFIVINGIDRFSYLLTPEDLKSSYNLFTSFNFPSDQIEIYYDLDDWAIIKVLNPNYKIPLKLNPKLSKTIENLTFQISTPFGTRSIGDNVRFYYEDSLDTSSNSLLGS